MFEDNEKKCFCSVVTVAKSGQIVICKKSRELLVVFGNILKGVENYEKKNHSL